MSRTPSPFDYGSRSNSSPIPFSEPPNYSNYTGHFAPSLVPHAAFPFVEGFAPNFRLSATAVVQFSAAPSSVATSEISRSVKAWNKIVAAVNKAGTEKTLKQCKEKIKKPKTSVQGCKNKQFKNRPWNQK